jgi:hypothetical protein
VALIAAFAGGVWTAILTEGWEWPFGGTTTVATTPSPTPTPTASESAPPAPRQPYAGDAVAYGDFVMVSARPCLKKLGYSVDGKADRRIGAAAADLRQIVDTLPGGVILHLGANGGASEAELNEIMDILGPDRAVVISTIQIPDDPDRYTFEEDTNAAIMALPQRFPNVRVLSWNALSLTNPTWLNADGSMTKEGCTAFAAFADDVLRRGR